VLHTVCFLWDLIRVSRTNDVIGPKETRGAAWFLHAYVTSLFQVIGSCNRFQFRRFHTTYRRPKWRQNILGRRRSYQTLFVHRICQCNTTAWQYKCVSVASNWRLLYSRIQRSPVWLKLTDVSEVRPDEWNNKHLSTQIGLYLT
jgi:hypothetical protein